MDPTSLSALIPRSHQGRPLHRASPFLIHVLFPSCLLLGIHWPRSPRGQLLRSFQISTCISPLWKGLLPSPAKQLLQSHCTTYWIWYGLSSWSKAYNLSLQWPYFFIFLPAVCCSAAHLECTHLSVLFTARSSVLEMYLESNNSWWSTMFLVGMDMKLAYKSWQVKKYMHHWPWLRLCLQSLIYEVNRAISKRRITPKKKPECQDSSKWRHHAFRGSMDDPSQHSTAGVLQNSSRERVLVAFELSYGAVGEEADFVYLTPI